MFDTIGALRRVAAAFAVLAFGAIGAGAAQAQVYNYTGPLYVAVTPHSAANCAPVGGCSDFTTAQNTTGSFTTAAPLAPNLVSAAVTPFSYSFNAGAFTISSANPGARIHTFTVTTNGSGAITGYNIVLERWRDDLPAGHVTIAPNATTSNGRVEILQLSTGGVNNGSNTACLAIGAVPSGVADVCTSANVDTFGSQGTAGGGSFVAAGVPTLSEWAMITLAGLLGAAGVMYMRRRRVA